MILVASVHHTGTKLIFNDLLKDWKEINQQEYGKNQGKIRIHIDRPFLEDLKYWRTRAKLIVPLRHPRAIAIGWKSRAKPLWDLEDQIELLKKEIDPYEPAYLPIDKEDREEWLDKVNLRFKLNLTTEWPVIGQHGGDYHSLNDKEEELVKTWMKDGFFGRFGYDI